MLTDFIRLSLALAAKDLRLYFRDKVGVALGFALPIGLVAIFASVFGNMGGDDGGMPKLTLRVADLDQTEMSRRFIRAVGEVGSAEVSAEDGDHHPWTRDALETSIRHSRIPLGLVIGKGFAASVDSGDAVPIEVLRDPTKETEFQLASMALMPALMSTTGGKFGRRLTNNGLAALHQEGIIGSGSHLLLEKAAGAVFDLLEKSVKDRENASRPAVAELNVVSRPTGAANAGFSFQGMSSILGLKETLVGGGADGPPVDRHVFMLVQSVAGTSVMMILFGLAACGRTILEEREGGTLRRLLATPAHRGAIIGGKFLQTFVIGLMQLLVMFAFGALAFGLPVLHHLGGTILVSVAVVSAATSFGVLLATIGRTAKQIDGIATLVILLMSATGGSWIPLFLMPKWMQTVGHFTLNAWAMDGYMGVLAFQNPLRDILLPVGVLFAVAIVFCALAVTFFQRRFAGSDRG